MTPQEFREATLAISSARDDTSLDTESGRFALYALGLAGEAGEIVDEVKKLLFHGKELSSDTMLKEAGDVLWYLDRLLMMFDAELGDAMQANVDKLRARYPNGWDAAAKHHSWDTEATR